MNAFAITPHFADPIDQCQRTFRALLGALSRPGSIARLPAPPDPPAPLGGAVAAIALTLLDFDSPLWLDGTFASVPVHRYLHYHTGAPSVMRSAAAAFAFIGDARSMPQFSAFAAGELAYPDRSTTLVIQIPSLTNGRDVTLSGPGIERSVAIAPAGLADWFWPAWNENAARYPLGVDLFLADSHAVICLPRTTKARF
jgi:alpha-D-ribose 1-methylphosphonate 5-triphosphate synthase subunit PhnH